MSTKITAAVLARDAKEFLAFKRAMGMGYLRAEFVLNGFVRFVRDQYGERSISLERAVSEWVVRIEGRKATTVGNEFGVVRQLCLFCRRSDPHCFVPDHTLAPVKESVFVPYIFSRDEILALVTARYAPQGSRHDVGRDVARSHARAVLHRNATRRGYKTAHGRRRSAPGCLDGSTEQGRSRILAIREDLAAELRQYIRHRAKVLAARGEDDPMTLFIRRDGSALTLRAASDALRGLLRDLGLKPPRGRSGARPYEFRHVFAVHRLTAWAVDGADVHAKLLWLSAYLGHQNVLGTEVYLKATPQLL